MTMQSEIDPGFTDEDIRAALVRTGRIPEGDPEGVGDIVVGMINGDVTLRDVQGLTDDQLEAVYATAYNHFKVGRLEKADQLMNFLCLFEPRTAKYWTGLGAVRMSQKNYDGASHAYGTAANIDIDAPRPPFRLAEALMAKGEKAAAREALDLAIENAGDKEDFKEIRERAQALLALLSEDGGETAA